MANKIKYGLSKVYYAVATIAANGSATYETPVALPGAVSLTLDADSSRTDFWADNIKYWVGNANNGYSGSLEIATIPESFYTDILGEFVDGKKVRFEETGAPDIHFALLFQFEGDAQATRHVMYNCIAGRPASSGSTKEESIEPQTETIDITATAIYNTTLDKYLVKASTESDTDATVYNQWFSTVQNYVAPATT